MNYENLIRDINIKYNHFGQKRRFKNKDFMTRLVAATVPYLLFLLLRWPFLRVPYISAMKSRYAPKELRNHMGLGVRRTVTVRPILSRTFKTGRALIIYYSNSGNTEKVALAIEEGCKRGGLEPTIKNVVNAFNEDLYDYDLVFIGTPVIHGLPQELIMEFMLEKGDEYRRHHEVRLNMQRIPGKNALVFVTYSGPHVGVSEALPAGKYLRQELEHFGFDVKDEWYVIGEFHGWKDGSTKGKLGDIRGRPNPEDLARIEQKTENLIRSLE